MKRRLLALILKPEDDRTMGVVTFTLIRDRVEDGVPGKFGPPTAFQLFLDRLFFQVLFNAKNRSWIPRYEGYGLVSWRGLLMSLRMLERRTA